MEEVWKHNNLSDCWITIAGKVYKIPEKWSFYSHPGGHLTIQNLAGRDATDSFENYHPYYVHRHLKSFLIGKLEEQDVYVTPFMKDCRNLRQKMLEERRFKTDYTHYFYIALRLISMFALVLYCSFGFNSFWMHFIGAVLLGIFWQ